MPAIEVGPGKSVAVAFTAPEPEGTFVSGPTRGGANALVVFAVRIGELTARPTELGFGFLFRFLQFAA